MYPETLLSVFPASVTTKDLSVGVRPESDRVRPDSGERPTDFYESDRTSGVYWMVINT